MDTAIVLSGGSLSLAGLHARPNLRADPFNRLAIISARRFFIGDVIVSGFVALIVAKITAGGNYT